MQKGKGGIDKVSYVDDKRYVLEHTDRRTLLEQLAEEAAELSQAALKLIRAEKLSDNPTPANVSIASEQLNEELADVLVAADAVGIPILESCDNSKWRRWAARIRKERERKNICDDNQRALLMCRYIKGMRWEDVASELGYTWRWTHKLHSKALDAIDIKEDIERQY